MNIYHNIHHKRTKNSKKSGESQENKYLNIPKLFININLAQLYFCNLLKIEYLKLDFF